MFVKRRQQKRSLDAVGRSGPLRHCTLEKIHRLVVLAEPGVDVGEMIGRDVGGFGTLFELAQYLPRFLLVACYRVRMAALTQPDRVISRHRHYTFNISLTLGL